MRAQCSPGEAKPARKRKSRRRSRNIIVRCGRFFLWDSYGLGITETENNRSVVDDIAFDSKRFIRIVLFIIR